MLSVGLALLGAVLLSGGLVGIYVARSEATGALRLIGFALAFAGAVLVAGSAWEDAFILPALAREAPELLLTEPPGRVGAYPCVPTVLVMVGAVVQALPLPPVLGVPGAVVFDAGVAWLRFVLLTGRGTSTE